MVLGFPVVAVPNPSGLGYVVPRLRRSGFLMVVLECSRGNSRLVFCNTAPEARKIVAQCGSAGHMEKEDSKRRRCGRCLRWLELRPTWIHWLSRDPKVPLWRSALKRLCRVRLHNLRKKLTLSFRGTLRAEESLFLFGFKARGIPLPKGGIG